MTSIYGIKNCDTMKKAMTWLTQNEIEFNFHDYRKDGLEKEFISQWIAEFGWEKIINKRGTTWRALDEGTKNNMNDAQAIEAVLAQPAMIKRPLLIHNNKATLGFKAAEYETIFN
ncbi:ArsC family transcriptional regulator [Marinomonas sp. SBI22]|uniref:ArsC family reductase n=1 Tax=unclassified Marinomonas TaxID=196814 RepID=UPI0007AF2BD1|nr:MULTISPECIES: ArsC family reductase [unclassified Marinomonas]KZM40763.1 ArsC family transcriptional regulator [Marinomonas sp. SBI8L]KZM46053.1 ArsC family transcriptional regulator [Marinomonas sp. SBI22]